MASLFLICPECFRESDLRADSDDDTYFLTALGAAFDEDPTGSLANVEYLLSSTPISEISIYQNTDCEFINQPFGEGRESIGLALEGTFSEAYRDIKEKPVVPISVADRKLAIAETNLHRQLQFVARFLEKYSAKKSESIALKGLLYRDAKSTSELVLIKEINADDL